MVDIKLTRVDERLIHGQVVTQWLNKVNANKIIIVDKFLSTNQYLSQVYVLAAPAGTDVLVMAPDDFAKKSKNNQFDDGNYMILFKLISNLKEAFDKGFTTKEVQIANVGAKDDRKVVYQTVALSEKEAKDLLDIQKKGVDVFFQQVPGEKRVSLNDIIQKNFSNLN